MDPLSQAVIGASLSQCFAKKKNIKIASAAGALGGMFPDVDVLITSKVDPLLALQFHRHFTHSLFMVAPLGLIVAGFLWFFIRKKKEITFKELFFFSFLGVLTHGLLDACTSYGTQLLWPFSNFRVAWNNISIIDPLFTLPALVGVLIANRKQNLRLAYFTMFWMLGYLSIGVYQRDAAIGIAKSLAYSRNHSFLRIEAKPSIGNLFLWRTLYETPEKRFYVDAVHTLPWLEPKVYEGDSIPHWKPEDLKVEVPEESTLARDIERFDWFSDRYLIAVDGNQNVVGDLRYASIPNSLEPLWGIEINAENPDEHIKRVNFRNVNNGIWNKYKKMLLRD